MENDDEFVDIIGYEGLYQINRKGEVLGLKSNKILKKRNHKGYIIIGLYDAEKKNKKFTIHKLLAIQFIPNPNNLPMIDHIDRNKQNNNLENLRWCDAITNVRNKDCVINRQGHIQLKTTKKGNYYQASFSVEYNGKRISKSSYDLDELEKWLEEMRIQYPRI
jgi:hypothetical protein